MPSSFEKQKLLVDTLHDQDYAQFRRDLLRHTCQEFRRHHRPAAVRALPWLALAATLLLGIYLGHTFTPQWMPGSTPATTHRPQISLLENPAPTTLAEITNPPSPAETMSGPESIIASIPAAEPAVQIVGSIPFPDTAVIRSVAQKNITITTDPRGLPAHLLVRTTKTTETLTDDQLLALFPNRPAGLIHLPNQKLFVLGPPRD